MARGLFEALSGLSGYQYVTSTVYTPTGNLDCQDFGNGVWLDNAYELATDRLAQLQVLKSSDLLDLTYT